MLRQIIVGAFLCFTFAPSIVTQNPSEVSDGSLASEKVPNLHFFLTNAQIEMELIIERTEKNEGFTLGRLSILKHVDDVSLDGEEKEFLYDTLEPQWTEDTTGKRLFMKKFAITPGRYPVVITYSRHYDRWLPLLLWVRKFKDVRIIAGKTVEDISSGVIIGNYHGEGRMIGSFQALIDLKRRIVAAKEQGEGVFLTIKEFNSLVA